MSWKRSICFFSIFSFIFSSNTAAQVNAVNPVLKNVKSYKIYYGEANEQVIKRLSKYDMVIIEPYAFTREQVQQLKKSGTVVLGYVSVLELEVWHKSQVMESDYYYRDSEKMKIEKWDTYIMNLADNHYRSIIINKVKQQIVGKGIDGVFLDTVGDIDDYFYDQAALQEKFRLAYVNLLKEIKSVDSNLLLVQNWGFETIKSAALNFIHGVLWEDFNKQVIAEDQWSQGWMRYFKKQGNKIVTFTVTPDDISKKYSTINGFIPTINPNDIYNN
ncbi:endo alpha-1,4 polygalactosaminidase [Bacillus paramobilis]|uniref:Endo alpha-1,4 polygalactosaminidase n=1 Tax=Bacillus paramobilis TaxID=2817477 RepID=A0ABZ2VNW2_9BACI|nr:glucanotransferase [Bacillus cereus]PER29163.1 glucanotransferase [Bacillus cereus]PEU84744.1 glucanotransferase [Bacillus cereus]PGT68160.1 glucanotransferase [Bacillus cereus]PGV94188.1 glucanotransferase [Bacillus cereus]